MKNCNLTTIFIVLHKCIFVSLNGKMLEFESKDVGSIPTRS